MAKGKETVPRTLLVALVLSIVFSVVVSTAAVVLRPAQIKNQNLDIKTNILSASGMLPNGAGAEEIESIFEQFEVRLVDLETGDYVEPSFVGVQDPMKYDMYKASSDPEMSTRILSTADKAGIKRRPNISKIYTLSENGSVKRVVLPIHGYGLWSTLYGFMSLESDLNTIEGLGFYAHAETPGLGGEVDNPRWKSQWVGKTLYDEDKTEPQIRLMKGGVGANTPDKEHKVDALSGATLTSRGVQNLVNYWMGDRGYAPFLKKLREGEV
ncbi:Na+-transporting NADH:ubiquinone oxidoreductase subunit C [Marinobacter sp. LV10R510-11A]|uniref:Na(+)-translocating NADH-quinone reductase subunit C n=1 Tax=Marinobacter sp. LV10R510-11A TaxID=1415568 RepID=UPI000BB983D7|nr:Na(+)-translocating NADH-quinone reductase subunit C [Marinobacter sp. LV10R510-11A]SOB74875.1 Na+-transporting NADH:ubiquinone oxidoreductase subunit C [Marinobacter sp. LV10R510-11A]